MKIRTGFVSNSSSSSFIIATVKSRDELIMKMEIEADLGKLIKDIVATKEELKEYFEDDLCYCPEDIESDETYKLCLKAIDEGKTIYFGEASDDTGDAVETLICHNGLKKIDGVDIIQSDGGY